MTTHLSSPRVCRLCLTEHAQLHRIFSGEIVDLAEKIFDITALEIEDINGFPSLICELCRSQILVSHEFVLQCRVSDWKYQKLLMGEQPVPKKQRLSTDSSSSGIGDLAADESGTSTKVSAKSVPPQHDALRRLKSDDKMRRHSIDQIRKTEARKLPKRRLSEFSQHDKAIVRAKHEVDGRDSRKKQCPICGVHVINLKLHTINIHTEVPRMICPFCGKHFKYLQSYKCHMNSHKGIKPYQCKICHKSYSYSTSLHDHVKSHQERYHCVICNAGFTHKKIMKEHLLIHERKQ